MPKRKPFGFTPASWRRGFSVDRQRSAVYGAERRWESTLPRQRRLTPLECTAIVRAIFTAPWTVTEFGRRVTIPKLRFPESHLLKWAYGSRREIVLPPWARTVPTVLHETAHALVGVAVAHGPLWARTMHELVRRFFTEPQAHRHAVCYSEARVISAPMPRKRRRSRPRIKKGLHHA